MGARFDCRYLVPVTINLSSKSQFFQETIKNLLHFLIHQDHLHQTTILILLIFLLLLFLRTEITLSMNAKAIHFEIQDSPSEALLILLPASFLLPPTLFWKVFIIVVASSPWLHRLSGMVRMFGEWIDHQTGLGLCGSHTGGQEVEETELGNGQLPPPPTGLDRWVPAETSISIADDQPETMEGVLTRQNRLSSLMRGSGEWIDHQTGLGLCGSHTGGQEVEETELGNGQLPPPPAGLDDRVPTETSISIPNDQIQLEIREGVPT